MLKAGDRGDQVKAVQQSLVEHGYTISVDGIFGPGTEAAVRDFQRNRNLAQDGIVGPKTRAHLDSQPSKKTLTRSDIDRIDRESSLHPNLNAFLDMISHAEGTDRFGDEDGYNVIVGGGLFSDYSDHPNKKVWLPAYNIYSTAAGRYQILHRFWVHYKKQLGLPDFSPASQDLYAIQQIKERRAYEDVLNGRVEQAISKCRNIWASLPGAGYSQREVPMHDLILFYSQRGGTVS